MYIVEGESGNFIMDTWHETVGNIWDLGERPMAEGYDHEQLKQGLDRWENRICGFCITNCGAVSLFLL